MRPPKRRISRVVKSDQELALEARAEGMSAIDADKLVDERKAARDAAQATYETKPPTKPYVRQD